MEHDLSGPVSTEESYEALTVTLEDALERAFDSACNRTCCSPLWLEKYMVSLEGAPAFVKGLLQKVDEAERFRFSSHALYGTLEGCGLCGEPHLLLLGECGTRV